MNEVELMIWGRTFKLEVVYDCYSGEEVLDIQREALGEFMNANTEIDLSLNRVKDYCLTHDSDNIGYEIDNIFKFVVPKSIFVKRTDEHIVALICNYKFNEHELAIVFKNGRLFDIGSGDIIF